MAHDHQTKQQTRQIFNIKFDPFNKRRLAAVSENQIQIFDLRAANQVLYSIKSDKDLQFSQGKLGSGDGGGLLGERHANDYGGTFSGFDWCLNRENLIVTYSKRSSFARFWDLTSCDQPIAFKDDLLSKGVKRGDEHPAAVDGKPSQGSQPLVAGLAVGGDEEYSNRPQAVAPSNVPVEQYRCMDCQEQILSLSWKPRAVPQVH